MRFPRSSSLRWQPYLEVKPLIDLAPMIDIVFQLLIFFLLTSSFIFQPGIKINLPRAVTSEVIHEPTAIIAMTAENLIYFEGRVVTMAELKSRIQTVAEREQPLLIKADRKTSLGRVVEVWDLCRAAGIEKINLATNQELR